MSDWGWVALGHAVTWTTLGGYTAVVAWRRRRLDRSGS